MTTHHSPHTGETPTPRKQLPIVTQIAEEAIGDVQTLAEVLYANGWASPCDAQWEGLGRIVRDLKGLVRIKADHHIHPMLVKLQREVGELKGAAAGYLADAQKAWKQGDDLRAQLVIALERGDHWTSEAATLAGQLAAKEQALGEANNLLTHERDAKILARIVVTEAEEILRAFVTNSPEDNLLNLCRRVRDSQLAQQRAGAGGEQWAKEAADEVMGETDCSAKDDSFRDRLAAIILKHAPLDRPALQGGEAAAMIEFARCCLQSSKEAVADGSMSEEDEATMELAQRLGVGNVRRVPYDPVLHGTDFECEPGDLIWYWGAPTIRPAQPEKANGEGELREIIRKSLVESAAFYPNQLLLDAATDALVAALSAHRPTKH